MISHFEFSPPPTLCVQETGNALLAELSSTFPALASQFCCVFSEHTEGRDRSLVGLGSRYPRAARGPRSAARAGATAPGQGNDPSAEPVNYDQTPLEDLFLPPPPPPTPPPGTTGNSTSTGGGL